MSRTGVTYVSADGNMHEKRSYGLHSVSDAFWGGVNLIGAFFATMVNPSAALAETAAHRRNNAAAYSQFSNSGLAGARRTVAGVSGFGDGAHQVPMATGGG